MNCPECDTELQIKRELRHDGEIEEIAECPGCGYTESYLI